MNFQGLTTHFKEMKHYFIAAILVFALSLYLGWSYSDQFSQFLQSQTEGIKMLSQKLSGKENPQLWFFIIIFLNNAIKSVIIIFLGLFFGVLPLFMLVANGMILGYVLSLQAKEDTLMLVLKGILPHGIIEIPAILLACAYGIRLGMLVCQSLLQAFTPEKRTAKHELSRVLKLTKPLMIIIIIALFIAAIIESTLTFWLVHM